MASPEVAIATMRQSHVDQLSASDKTEQAKASDTSTIDKSGDASGAKLDGTTGKEKQGATTASANGQASPVADERAEFPDEYKPHESLIKNKKWDHKSKDFTPTVLKGYSELEQSHTRVNQEKSLLNNRQTTFQKVLSSDPKSINEWRKSNGLPEIPVAKTYSEQAKDEAELFSHIQRAFNGEDKDGTSTAWLNKRMGGIQELSTKAAVEDALGKGKTPAEATKEFYATADKTYHAHIAQNPEDQEIFDNHIQGLTEPGQLLGSYGLSLAHIALTPEHVKAWAKIGKALKLAENYDKAVEDGVQKGVDEAMTQKRKSGNAQGIGAQSKNNSAEAGSGESVMASRWSARHG